ncbi:MAG TPA: cytochrome, partial [Coleofasciculaceae cyanobacterium]
MRKIIIGVMGPGEQASSTELNNAYALGKHIATQGWVLLTGGRNTGVMDAASKGAKAAGGLTVGILPTNNTTHLSDAVDIAITTDMGNARNNINVLSSDVVIACGMGTG